MEQKDIIAHIELTTPTLSSAERDAMWGAVSTHLPVSSPITRIPSPYLFYFTHNKPMTAFILTLILIMGGGSTAMASDAARPGDLLYPLERALENARFHLTPSSEGRAILTQTLTEERLEELREIIDEETIISFSNVPDTALPLTAEVQGSTTILLAIEVDVFIDTTVVKVELNDRVFYFETDVATKDKVLAVLKEKFPTLTDEALTTALSFELQDRASRPKDKGIVSLSERGQARVGTAMEAILSFLDTTTEPGDVHRDEALAALMSEVDTAIEVTRERDEVRVDSRDHRYEIRLHDNGDSKIEVRNGDTRVRIEEKDGEVRVRTKNIESNDDESDDIIVNTPARNSFGNGTLEVEADVFTDTTLVTLEWQGEKIAFETTARTRDGVIAVILQKFPALTHEAVTTALLFGIEDRASRPKDDVTDIRNTVDAEGENDDGKDKEEDERSRHGDDTEEDGEDDE